MTEAPEELRVVVSAGSAEPRSGADPELRLLELHHRVKNLIAVIGAITSQTLRDDVPVAVAREQILERLAAMSSALDLLVGSSWEEQDLETIARKALIQSGVPGRFLIGGHPTSVNAETTMFIALALHELEVNAIKHGAFSSPSGRVTIRWEIAAHSGDLCLEWRESGGPSVVRPAGKGFGTRLLSTLVERQLKGQLTHAFEAEGVRCTLRLPARWLVPAGAGQAGGQLDTPAMRL